MTDGTIFVRRLHNLPLTVRGVTTPNPDGTFSVYINAALPPEVQEAALQHEVYHIEHDHMYNLDPVAVNEREANERPSRIVEQPVPASAAALHCAQHMSGRCAPDESAAAGTNASSSPRCVAAPHLMNRAVRRCTPGWRSVSMMSADTFLRSNRQTKSNAARPAQSGLAALLLSILRSKEAVAVQSTGYSSSL